jgi:6-pyruvoyltetrahydropterin/6-carboxytetrahydropterin synthase
MIIGKEFKFESAHCLEGHPKCGRMHGHTYRLRVEVEGPIQEDTGMVMDLHDLSAIVKPIIANFDHDTLNAIFYRPTCELMAAALFAMVNEELPEGVRVYSVLLQEGEGGYAYTTGRT